MDFVDICYGIDDIPADVGPTSVTIGVFDGLHRGHQQLVSACVEHARANSQVPVMVTFDPHPVSVFLPERAPLSVVSVERRLELAEEMGIEMVLVIDFTKELEGVEPRPYVRDLLVGKLHAHHVVVGENFTFGAGPAVLRKPCGSWGRSLDLASISSRSWTRTVCRFVPPIFAIACPGAQ